MNLLDYTIQKGFLPQLKCESLEATVSALVGTLVAADVVTAADSLVQEVLRREREGSTAVGGGLVIPHARSAEMSSVHIAVGTLAVPLDLAATDGLPVDIVILLVGPGSDPRQMLKVLAGLARLVRQDAFLGGLRAAATTVQLAEAFTRAGEFGA